MTLAFTFPGQGSQSVGMGKELADAFPEARAVFSEVDDALGQKLSETMWNGPEDELTLTANAQPALMAVSMAVVRVLASQGFDLASKAAYLAGLAVGFWHDQAEVTRNWALDAEFQPQMEASRREELYQRWKQAVERSRDWV